MIAFLTRVSIHGAGALKYVLSTEEGLYISKDPWIPPLGLLYKAAFFTSKEEACQLAEARGYQFVDPPSPAQVLPIKNYMGEDFLAIREVWSGNFLATDGQLLPNTHGAAKFQIEKVAEAITFAEEQGFRASLLRD